MSTNKKPMKYEAIILSEQSRPITEQLQLDPRTEVVLADVVSRRTGTGYRDLIYRVRVNGEDTDDAIIVHKRLVAKDGNEYDEAVISRGHFARQRCYGKVCRAAATRLNIPVDVALAIGPTLLPEFTEKIHGRHIDEETAWDLDDTHHAGIKRRKRAILSLLPNASSELRKHIDGMGQLNSARVARYLLAQRPHNHSDR